MGSPKLMVTESNPQPKENKDVSFEQRLEREIAAATTYRSGLLVELRAAIRRTLGLKAVKPSASATTPR